MKSITKSIPLGLAVLMMGAAVHADPTTGPWTPAPQSVDPSPAATAAQSVTGPMVLIIPFQQVGDTSRNNWVAQALQEDLAGQVSRDAYFVPKVSDKPVLGSDSSSALQAGRDAGAAIVVFGSFQSVDDQLRVTAQVADVASGHAMGSLQATGGVTDLFKMEDSLAQQLHQILPQPASQMPTITYGAENGPVTTAPAQPPQADDYASQAPPPDYGQDYSSPDYSSQGYASPGYSYGSYYPGYYPSYYTYYPPYFYGGFYYVNRYPYFRYPRGRFHTWSGNWRGGWGGGMHGGGMRSGGHR
jgi:TolB-like protein